MPSFAVHAICAKELLKKINLDEDKQKEFLIANTIPDICRINKFTSLDPSDQRKAIQVKKRVTHFKTDLISALEYPNCESFVFKYEKKLKEDHKVLAYFFHLYTDYYFVKRFLPSNITVLDKNKKECTTKEDAFFVKINRTNKIYEFRKFFSKSSDISIYGDYSRSTSYLVQKYNLKVDTNNLIEYVDTNGFNIDVDETNPLFAYYAIIKLDKYINKIKPLDDNYLVFTKENIDTLVEDIISSFEKEYHYILKHYQR